MKFLDYLAEVIAVEMCIDLRRGYRLMTKHFLHSAQVGASFDQVGRKRMSEGMGTDFFLQADSLSQLSDNGKHHYPRELASVPVQERVRLKTIFGMFVRRHPADFEDAAAEIANVDFRGEGGNPDNAEIYYELRNGLMKVAYPEFVDGQTIPTNGRVSEVNRRDELAKFIIDSETMPEAIVNRYWGHFFGYGFTGKRNSYRCSENSLNPGNHYPIQCRNINPRSYYSNFTTGSRNWWDPPCTNRGSRLHNPNSKYPPNFPINRSTTFSK
jgi:hypothetical protein